MSMSDGLRAFRHEARPSNATTVSTLTVAGYPSGTATLSDSETTARKLSVVDACMEILSNSVGKLPNFVMDNTTRERVQHPLLHLLNVRPNEAMTPFIRKKVLENSRNEGGNGYDWIIRDPRSGLPKELIPVPWQLVHPWRDTGGRVWYTVTHPVTGTPITVPNEDMCHYKSTTRNGLVGISPLQRASEVISTARAAQQYELNYYQNGGQPAGVLKTESDLGKSTIDDPQNPGKKITRKDAMRREWERIYSGPTNSHRIAILDLGLDYKPLAASNKDAQFVESKEVSVKDIARFFGVPLYKLNEGKQAYGSNEQNAIEYVVSTLHPIVTQYEEEQTYKLLTDTELKKGLEIRINLMAELKGDTGSRGAWYGQGMTNGWFSPNDIRALEDLPDIEGGDDYQASLNYIPRSLWRALSVSRNGGKTE